MIIRQEFLNAPDKPFTMPEKKDFEKAYLELKKKFKIGRAHV